eukprot:gene12488-14658_t
MPIERSRHGLLPESLVNVYIAQVLCGLEYLHRQGVIHRDIKAANLLISTDGSIKLADFGVSVKVSDLSADNPDDSFAGTPYWMAPEIIQMQGVSTACDVWSLGCTIIELLTGTPPYFGLAPAAALYKIVQEDHPPIPQGISGALKDFLLQCFKKDENMRSSAKQLLNHPWIRAVKTADLVKNARMEILTYNAQLQEATTIPLTESPVVAPVPTREGRPRSRANPLPKPTSKPVTKPAQWVAREPPAPAPHSPKSHLTLASPREQSRDQKAKEEAARNEQIRNQLSKYSEEGDDDDDEEYVKRPLKQTLKRFVEKETDNDDFFQSSVNLAKTGLLKPLDDDAGDWDDKGGFDGFSSDEEKPKAPAAAKASPKARVLQLKVRETVEEWDSEIEDTFDSVAPWLEDDDGDTMLHTINMHDKQKEQVTKTIVDFLSQLKPLLTQLQHPELVTIDNISASPAASESVDSADTTLSATSSNAGNSSSNNQSQKGNYIIDKLIELFQRFPDEKRLLISNGEGGVYFRLPLITLLEILELGNAPVLSILRLINQAMAGSNDILETVCILNGIPIITRFAARPFGEEVREEVSRFVLQLCVSSPYSLNMFIAGSRGCKVLVDLVDSDYFNSSSLIHNALDSISQIFRLNSALPKTSLCHLFARTELLQHISLLLHQIFMPSVDSDSTAASIAKTQVKLARTSSSVQLLPREQFERVLAYSVKAADILLFFSTGDSLVKEEMSSENVLRAVGDVLAELYTWNTIAKDVRAFLLRMLKVIKNLSMDQNNRAKLDHCGIIPTLINYLGYHHSRVDKVSEIYNQVLHSLYHLLLLDKARQDKALKSGILPPLLFIINERGPLKELALPILFDFVRLSTSSSSRILLWECDTLDKLLVLLEDRNWFADAIESIAAWAILEPVPVYERLTGAGAADKLIGIVHSSHIKHPSFSKSLIPLLHLMEGSVVLIGRLIDEGLVQSLVECLELDNSPVSKITLLKIVSAVHDYYHLQHQKTSQQPQVASSLKTSTSSMSIGSEEQQMKLRDTLQVIAKQDESEIVKTIADRLLADFANHTNNNNDEQQDITISTTTTADNNTTTTDNNNSSTTEVIVDGVDKMEINNSQV